MTGLSSVLQPLSTDSTLLKPTDDHHRDRGKPPPIDSAIIVDPPPPVPQSLAGRQPPPVPLPSTLNESENSPPAIRHHRYSLAAIAREKTNNALANLSLRPKPSSQSLHSSSSSSGSPTKLESTVGGSTTQRTPNPKPTISDLSQTRSAEADVSRPIERTHPAPIDHLASSNQPQRRDEERASPPAHEPASAPTTRNLQGALSKMHQTSSRLLRMTDEERPFTRDFEDLFSTLMVSLPLSAHRVRFQKVEHTFTSEEAINNLGSLKFSQSNRMPDPKDPSRIVTTTTTTTFSMAKEMARSVCQRFMDARFIESADGKYIASFPLKNAVWQLTPKGMHVLTRFCQRNGISQRHVLDVLDSARNTMQLVILERDSTTDKLSHDRATIEVIFRRFTGQEGPNLKSSITSSDSDSLSDYYNGLIGVKMAKDRKILDQVFKNTFTGKAAIDWLMDCCTTVDRREVYEIAELFVSHGLMLSVLEDKVFIHQNPGASRFQPTKNAIYLLSEKGERVVGWRADDKDSDDARTVSVKTGNGKKDRGSARDSNNNRLHAIVTDAALRLLFREFLRDTHCEENLSFYLEVRDFTKSYDNAEKGGLFNRPDAIRENLAAAYGLYNAFLAPGSPCELNIDHNLRNSLAGRMTRAVGDDGTMFQGLQEVVALFREAQASVFRLMYSDSVPKFLKEPKYAAMLSQHNFDNSSPSSHPSTSTSIPERSKSRAENEKSIGQGNNGVLYTKSRDRSGFSSSATVLPQSHGAVRVQTKQGTASDCIYIARSSSILTLVDSIIIIPFIVAVSQPLKFFFLAVVIFISLVLILAPGVRITSRLSALFHQIPPLAGKPTGTTAFRPLTTAAMAPQSFKKPPQPPPVFTGTPKSVIEDIKTIIEKSRAVQDKIAAELKPIDATFDKVMIPMAHDENQMGLAVPVIGFYQAVSADKALRNASTEAEKLISDFSIEAAMREDIFKLVDAAFEKKETLDPESQRLLEKERKNFIRNGLSLPAGEKRDRFKAIKKRLSDISIAFQKNLNEENGGLWFTPEELDGTPDDVLSTFEKGEGENAGKLRMTYKYPDLFPISKYCRNIETRRQVFTTNENKCNENVPLFREAIDLRDEAARLLGYPNHAAFMVEDKMAKTTKTVDDFLSDLRKRLTKGGASERKTLQELKEKDLKDRGEEKSIDGRYYLWDNRFYDRLMLEKDYSLDQEKLSEYFPLQTSIRGMLHIFEQLFGLVFVEIEGSDRSSIAPSGKGEDIVWHPDVKLYSVWDDEGEGNGFVGYLYLDLHPRDGKYGHAANFNIQPGFIDEKGNRRYPATALVCNFSKPSPKKPSLLKHDEVVTLFHELGHGIHDLVARTIYSRFHGTNTVRDFVEAPSQMLENWCWTPSQLKALSCHYSSLSPEYETAWKEHAKGESKPDAKLPDELIENLIKTKHVNDALFNLRQLHFGIFDMTVHGPESHKQLQGYDIPELYNRLRKEISGLDGPEDLGEGYKWGNGHATFGHLMGGYDAGYYGYLSSQVYSADMFHTVFAKNPMNAQEGRRYRHTVLERGGSQDEMQTLEDFLGRKPSTEAFYRELGLA